MDPHRQEQWHRSPRAVRAATQLCVAAAGMAGGCLVVSKPNKTARSQISSPPRRPLGPPSPHTTVHTNIPSRSRLTITGARPAPEIRIHALVASLPPTAQLAPSCDATARPGTLRPPTSPQTSPTRSQLASLTIILSREAHRLAQKNRD
ncbi:hypothetical protein HETIRDRAFT_452178 [Heterobasidion irregulare TC 32-1]|uniref:Uncharacterized protein n=1 Tax=Heterobasidion irregulare (strain TC 32-1) TaxID=747525 RepID=W4K449_HETIT|nr:uncharacterized protein HETIRDRAFT_452178 [Heterobasidion irregulare TC 32-1]ETW80618.1 hypothetical protein HETIRDRAFT_452178 [Heterobasidion irregulare TC 32-1]